jgi:hypothetical protein
VANEANISAPQKLSAPETRGILLSLFALGVPFSALDGIDEERRAVCSEAWHALLAQSEAEGRRILAEWRVEATCTLPRGLELLHPSWIAAALEGEPSHIIRLLLDDLPQPLRATVLGMPGFGLSPAEETGSCPAATKREVARLAFGWLAPLCESTCGPLAEALFGLAFDALLAEVTRRGARIVGQSLAGAPPALRARAMAAAGEPWAQVIGEVAAASLSEAERKVAMNHANVRIPDSARTPAERLLHVGLAALKSELAAEHPGSVCRVAGRLPVSLGRPMVGW